VWICKNRVYSLFRQQSQSFWLFVRQFHTASPVANGLEPPVAKERQGILLNAANRAPTPRRAQIDPTVPSPESGRPDNLWKHKYDTDESTDRANNCYSADEERGFKAETPAGKQFPLNPYQSHSSEESLSPDLVQDLVASRKNGIAERSKSLAMPPVPESHPKSEMLRERRVGRINRIWNGQKESPSVDAGSSCGFGWIFVFVPFVPWLISQPTPSDFFVCRPTSMMETLRALSVPALHRALRLAKA